MHLMDHFRYRPEIDGLRAIAVISVLLFHADFGCRGGYVGVDVFFVISGFLITSLIWKDLEGERFTFGHFWERRARRIIPALAVVTIVTLIVGWFLLMPFDFEDLGQATASQTVFAANIHYWQDSGYFGRASHEKPLLHTWSLAVEEQFYFIMPFVLWTMFRWRKLRCRGAAILILGTALLSSLALSVYSVNRYPGATFFLLPTRAWELLLGAIVAFLPASSFLVKHARIRELAALAGAALVLIPVFLYTQTTVFPGLAALPPCLGASLLIWANGRASGGPTRTGVALAWRPMVFIGMISYSLYLWHWPFLAFNKYLSIVPVPWERQATLLACAVLCAIASWKFVEVPFRDRKLGASRRSIFAFTGTSLGALFVCGLACVLTRGFPSRLPPRAQEFANASYDRAFQSDVTVDEVRSGKLLSVGRLDGAIEPTVLVWGDSHAKSALPAFDALLKERGLSGVAATHTTLAPVLDWYLPRSQLAEQSIEFNDSVLSFVESRRIRIVVLCAFWSSYATSPAGSAERSFERSLVSTVRRLVAKGTTPWILLDIPTHTFNIPLVLSRSSILNIDVSPFCARPTAENETDNISSTALAEIRDAGGRIIDPKPSFIHPTGGHFLIHSAGVALYFDDDHLTTKGAKLKLLPLLRDSLVLDE